ncbi:MAG: uracil-DNA glycosylase [Acidobacteria bacterium]|nr:uracil-DNA glycosylase [Acidobacteriota bacterium]
MDKSGNEPNPAARELAILQQEIVECRCCPRLVEWREQVAREKVRRFAEQEYWGKPVPSFGSHQARLFILGLAPAAHGGNRTGRMFTGDRSGDWLYSALHRYGFANQSESVHRDDGLELLDAYISAVIHCAPPDNKPFPDEMKNCRPYLLRELALLPQVRVMVTLGRLAFDTAVALLKNGAPSDAVLASGAPAPTAVKKSLPVRRRYNFAHGAEFQMAKGITLLASYHPSQQNTFTGILTEEMFQAVFKRAQTILRESSERSSAG